MKTMNFLPWREEEIKNRKETWLLLSKKIIPLLFFPLIIMHIYFGIHRISINSNLKQLNLILKKQMEINNGLILKSKNLQQKLEEKENNLFIIQFLLSLPSTLPDGITPTKIFFHKKNLLTITGEYDRKTHLNYFKKLLKVKTDEIQENKKTHQFTITINTRKYD